jgi:S1-C subfamily serine protease
VVVSRVEPGEKAQVAGLAPYMLLTRVDGRPVSGLDDFAARVAAWEAGERPAVEFTLEMMGKTRLAKITQD